MSNPEKDVCSGKDGRRNQVVRELSEREKKVNEKAR